MEPERSGMEALEKFLIGRCRPCSMHGERRWGWHAGAGEVMMQ